VRITIFDFWFIIGQLFLWIQAITDSDILGLEYVPETRKKLGKKKELLVDILSKLAYARVILETASSKSFVI
jgi:hypothetical protein